MEDAGNRTIQISCVLQYEKGLFFSGVTCGSITGEELEKKKEKELVRDHLKQDATELPPFILFILSYYLRIYSLILQ